MDLQRELFGGDQNGHPRCTILTPLELLQQGENVRSCLSSPCLSHPNDVLSSEDAWNGLDLNGRRLDKAQIRDGIQELSLQLEVLELHCPKVGASYLAA